MTPPPTTVADTCFRTSKGPDFCLFLFDLVRELAPATVVEMGTSVGVSGSYLAAALAESSGGRLVTLDLNADSVGVAERGMSSLGLSNVEAVIGPFEQTLLGVLDRVAPIDFFFVDGHHEEEPTLQYFDAALSRLAPGAVVVFDDIEWSDGMRRAWEVLRKHPAVEVAVSLREFGIVRLRQNQT